MTGDPYPIHHRHEVDVDTGAQGLFAYLDDHRRMAGHMSCAASSHSVDSK